MPCFVILSFQFRFSLCGLFMLYIIGPWIWYFRACSALESRQSLHHTPTVFYPKLQKSLPLQSFVFNHYLKSGIPKGCCAANFHFWIPCCRFAWKHHFNTGKRFGWWFTAFPQWNSWQNGKVCYNAALLLIKLFPFSVVSQSHFNHVPFGDRLVTRRTRSGARRLSGHGW